jgi:ureidoacrylate peracid hydrolase
MQNGFTEPGAPGEVPFAWEIVPNINRICGAVRAAGGHNYFLRFAMPPDPGDWPILVRHLPQPLYAVYRAAFAPGSHAWRLSPALDVAPHDPVLDKTRFSAFTPGTCALPDLLRDHQIATVIITGTMTNCCCESTARDAMQLGYGVIFVSDGTAALSDAAHNATLNNMASLFADVLTAEEVIMALC